MSTKHQDPPDPIKDFAEQQAQTAGLYMPQDIAIDYFNVVPPDGPTGKSLDGITFQNGSRFLEIGNGVGDPFTAPVFTNGAVTYMPNTCLSGLFILFYLTPLTSHLTCISQCKPTVLV